MALRQCIIVVILCSLSTINPVDNTHKEYHTIENDLFTEAVDFIIKHEGWHSKKNHPYIGYGHKLISKDKFDHSISEEFAIKLVHRDLKSKCSVFREFGKDSLILGMLAYNVGENRVLVSKLVNKLKSGDRDVYSDYIGFCYHKKRVISSIQQRRIKEYNQFYNKSKIIKANGFRSR